MDKINIIIASDDLNNLMAFLDRVEYKGLKEVMAINRIVDSLKSGQRIQEDTEAK